MERRFVVFGIVGVLSFLLQPSLAAKPIDPDSQHEIGSKIYNYRCYFCHGYSGDSNTVAANQLSSRPVDFTSLERETIDPAELHKAVKFGRPKTPMVGFQKTLSDAEISAVVAFILTEFVENKAVNTRYHTDENGWQNHDQYETAFPFRSGEILMDKPWEELTNKQRSGKRLFIKRCVTCHSGETSNNHQLVWSSEALSYPRNGYDHRNPKQLPYDGVSSATIYVHHDIEPDVILTSDAEKKGRDLYQINCAFCHGTDGTGKNWIGSFLNPRPRDLTSTTVMEHLPYENLMRRISDGIPNSSMPVWKTVLDADEIDSIVQYINVAFHPVFGINKRRDIPNNENILLDKFPNSRISPNNGL